VVLLDAGDLLFDTYSVPENIRDSSAKKAELLFAAYSKLGYDALNVGDQDLALGRDFLLDKAREFKINLISANIVDSQTGALVFKPYIVKEIGKTKIAIIGVMNDKISLDSLGPQMAGLRVADATEAVRKYVNEVRGSVKAVILVSQLGITGDNQIAKEVKGIDLIVGGHSKTYLGQAVKNDSTLIVQASEKGKYIGKIELQLKGSWPYNFVDITSKQAEDVKKLEKKLSPYSHQMAPLDKNLKTDMQMDSLVSRYKDEITRIEREHNAAPQAAQQASGNDPMIGLMGAKGCGSCHKEQQQFWSKTRHANAYDSLVKKEKNYSPECIGCHTTGYLVRGGYFIVDFSDREFTRNVQCEACHGVSWSHSQDPKINKPFNRIDRDLCVKCHDVKNDPQFDFARKMPLVRCPPMEKK
jgi:hypothetical protein